MNDPENKHDETQMPHFTKAEVLEVARMQRLVLWLFLALIVSNVLAVLGLGGITVYFGMIAAYVIFLCKLAAAVKAPSPVQYIFLALIPCLNIVALFLINGNATAVLKKHGIRVGIMGANKKQLAEYAASKENEESQCPH